MKVPSLLVILCFKFVLILNILVSFYSSVVILSTVKNASALTIVQTKQAITKTTPGHKHVLFFFLCVNSLFRRHVELQGQRQNEGRHKRDFLSLSLIGDPQNTG